MQQQINIGRNIARIRKEARLTQDDIAAFLGVTKASVSKWENGQSYPDIELLPRIAAYFGITIDELVGYEPQMPKHLIRSTYERLCKAFATQPFPEVHEECRQLAHDFYACYPLLVQIVQLYLNHLNLADEAERTRTIDESLELCERIRSNSDSATCIRMAECLEASMLLLIGKPQAAVEILADAIEPEMGADIILANAYQALGQNDEADEALQAMLYQTVIIALNRLSSMAMLHVGNPEKLAEICKRTLALIDAFDLDKLYVNIGAVYLTFAMAFTAAGNHDSAFDQLERFERYCRELDFPIKMHGDAFFDKVEPWIETTITTGTDLPRDEALIRQSMVADVAANPAFGPLAGDPRFTMIVKNLEDIART